MTHAFFKALLFLSAGSVILACHHEQDIFKMGGLRKSIPFTFWVFLIGSLALIAAPGTSGFFSKDEILFEAYASGHAHLYYAGLLGAFFTAIYTFRLMFIAFFGEAQGHDVHAPHGLDHHLPLAVLAVFAVLGGFIHLPLDSVLPKAKLLEGMAEKKHALEAASVAASALGVAVAWFFFHKNRALAKSIKESFAGNLLFRYFRAAFGFDWLYDLVFKRPYLWFTRVNAKDGVDVAITAIPDGLHVLHRWVATSQTGRIRGYAAAISAGTVLVIALVLFS